MKLIENWNIQRLKNLVKNPLFILIHDELKNGDKKDQASGLARLTMLRDTLKNLDEKGNIKITYKSSPGISNGRQYSSPRGYQGAPKWVRSYVNADEKYWDVDIINAHPCILLSICEKHQFLPESYSMLEKYVKEKSLVIEEEIKAGNSENIIKSSYLIALNNGNPKNTHKNFIVTDNFAKYKDQIEKITEKLQKIYTTLIKKTNNIKGTFMSLLLQQEENTILMKKIKPYLEKNKLKIAALMFDGCMVYKTEEDIDKILSEFINDKSEPILPSYIKITRKTFHIPGVKEVVEKYGRYADLILSEIQDKHIDFIWEHFRENCVLTRDEKFYYEFIEGKGWDKTSFNNLKRYIPSIFLKYYQAMEIAIENIDKKKDRKEENNDEKIREEKIKNKKKILGEMVRSCTYSRFNGTIECFKGCKSYIDTDFERKLNNTNMDRFFPLSGGRVLDFNEGKIIPMKKEHYFSKFSPATDLGNAKKIENFMKEVHPNDNVRIFFQKQLGMCIMGLKPDRRMYIWIGKGSNGKTKIAEMLFKISPFTVPLSTSALSGPKARYQAAENSHTSHLNNLRGARCAIVTESEEGDQLKEGIVKKLTGGDTIPIRCLNKEEESLSPTCRIIYLTNNILKYNAEKSMRDRIRYIHFGQSFEDEPDPNNPKHVKKDDKKVDDISTSFNDFLAWLLEGVQLYLKEGYVEPEEIKRLVSINQNASDPVRSFMMECMDKDEQGNIKLKDVFDYFVTTKKMDSRGITIKNFAKRVREYDGNKLSVRRGGAGGKMTLFGYNIKEDEYE